MKICFISLGCDKNLVDTEEMLGILRSAGHCFTDDETEADVIVVNTCCFIGDAKQESVNTLLEMADLKQEGKKKLLIAAGCLAQRYQKEILQEIPEVDAVIGTTAFDKIAELIDTLSAGKELPAPPLVLDSPDRLLYVEEKRVITTGGYYEYLKIAEGCDKHCTYCIIPSVRGAYRSIPVERLRRRAEELAASGVKELILVAQETSLYGVDLYGKKSLPMLLEELSKVEGIEWIRVLYCYPEEIDDALIEAIKTLPKVCHYLDMPIQHASDAVLRRMGRRTTKAELTDIVRHLREEIPDIAIRTTLIAGFPGETQEQFEELVAFVDEMEFDRLGVFAYSAEEDTPAAEFDDQIAETVKQERRQELMELQQEISLDLSESLIGEELQVIVEGELAQEETNAGCYTFVGRTYRDAPDVDGYIFFQCSSQLLSGDFVKVRVTGANEYDLIGEIPDEFAK